MSYKAIETLKKYGKFSKESIRIKGGKIEFDLLFGKENVPHLLGLHYTLENRDDKRGMELYNDILEKELSDEEIYNLVRRNYKESGAKNIQKRIETFDYFMNNLENGIIVENTYNPNKIGTSHFIVQDPNGEYLHLGIFNGSNGTLLENFNEPVPENIRDIIKTYLHHKKEKYFKNTKLVDSVKEITIYEDKLKEYIPFSFDEQKNELLLKQWKINKRKPIDNTVEVDTDKQNEK